MAPPVAIPPPDTPLPKYTVPQLKAKCQQLGIQGVSKFNKARLVQTILDATATHPQSQAPAQTAPPVQTAQTAPVPRTGNVTTSHQVVAAGATGSQSATRDHGTTSITASSTSVVANGTGSSVLVATSATQPIADETANAASASAPCGVPDARVATPSSATAPTTKRKRSSTKTAAPKRTKRTLMQDTPQPASSRPKTSSTVPKPSPASFSQPPSSQPSALQSLSPLPNSVPTPSSTSQKLPTQISVRQSPSTNPATSTRSDLPTLLRPQPLKHVSTETAAPTNKVTTSEGTMADVSKLPAASRLPSSRSAVTSASKKALLPSSTTTTRTTVIPKRVPKASINGKPTIKRPAFTPLKASTAQPKPLPKPPPQHTLRFPLTPLISDASFPDGTTENRVAHINSHFLNRLFLNLNAARSRPVLAPPFPTPVAYPPDCRSNLAFQGFHPQVFGCPNDAFKVAVRFWIARAHTMLMLGSGMEWSAEAGGMGLLGPDMSKWPPVTTCSKVVDGIFEITTEEVTDDSPSQITSTGKGKKTKAKSKALEPRANSTTTTAFLVLATTGDVIATSRPPTTDPSKQSLLPLIRGCAVRSDWHAFITGRSHTQPALDISSFVKTKDTNSFPSGISKSWLTRLPDAMTSEEFKVAQRAVLTSCALNSFSGEKLDAVQMDAEFLNNWVPLERGQKSKIELYLPESQQVVSVHLAPPPAHPALAIVHRTSGKSDYVLRETGHVVGDEDGGVVELWQGILGCDHKGMEIADVSRFWQGWEDRVRGSSDADF